MNEPFQSLNERIEPKPFTWRWQTIVLLLLLTGSIQMAVAWLLNLHHGLDHMQHATVWGFVGESVFYSLAHALLLGAAMKDHK